MRCINCKFLSPKDETKGEFPVVRCEKGLWDKDNKPGAPQYYSWGSVVRNRGSIKRHGEECTAGIQQGLVL